MSLDDFQSLENKTIDNIMMKRDLLKAYHQQEAQLNQSNPNIQFVFGNTNIYHQISNCHSEFDIKVQKNAGAKFHEDNPIRLINFAFAF